MRTLAVLFLLALAQALPAAEKFAPEARARVLAPLIEEETFALVRIDTTRVDPAGLAKALSALLPKHKDNLLALLREPSEFHDLFTKAGGTELVLSFASEEIPEPSFVQVPLKAGTDADALGKVLKGMLPPGMVVRKRGDALFAATPGVFARLEKGKPSGRPDLLPAVTAAGDTGVQALLLPTRDQRRVIEELVKLPVPGGSGKTLTQGVRWAALGAEVGAKPMARLTLHSADDTSARKMADLARVGLKALGDFTLPGEEKSIKDLFPREYAAVRDVLKPEIGAEEVVFEVKTLDAWSALAALAVNVEQRSGGVDNSDAARQMKQILLAMHNYHDSSGTFPPQAIFSREGKPLLSWRVALLPYIEQGALYRQFHLDEPWDSAHNKKLLAQIPKLYRSPRIKALEAGYTTYVVPVNKDFVFTGEKKGTKITEILDGTSLTGILLDASDEAGVPWSKPADLVVSEKEAWKGVLGHHPNFVLVGMGDGSVQRVAKTVPAKTLWALFTRAGGERLPDLSK